MKTTVKVIIFISCFVAATWLTYKLHGSPKVGIDDANIFFSYAENLAAGNGITYAHNPDHVEGFTSMLWMLICALVFSLGGDESAVLLVSTFVALLTQWILLSAIHRLAVKRNNAAWPYQCAYIVLILCSPAYVTWMTITLMDTCVWGLIIAAMTYVVLLPPTSTQGRVWATIPFALAPMSRPEGMLVAPVLVGLLWLRLQPVGLRSATRFCIGIGCALLMTTVALTVFRLLYFGYPVPNTYYAKVSPSLVYDLRQGIGYLQAFMLSGSIVGGCVAVVLLAGASWVGTAIDGVLSSRSMISLLRIPVKASGATALAASTLLLVPMLTGGDHFRMFRFYQPAYPLLCVTLVLLLSECRPFDLGDARTLPVWGGRNVAKMIAVGLVLAYWLFTCSSDNSWNNMRRTSPIGHEFRIAERGIAKGKKLKALFTQEGQAFPAIGVITAGGIARTYPGPIVDLMGLNNNFVAHFKGDRKGIKNHAAFEKDVFFHVQPDILLASPPVPPETNNFDNDALKGLFNDPRFTAQWRYGVISMSGDPARKQEAFVNTTFLKNMPTETGLEFHDTMIWSNKWVEVTVFPGRQN
jgi:hypothetical protein